MSDEWNLEMQTSTDGEMDAVTIVDADSGEVYWEQRVRADAIDAEFVAAVYEQFDEFPSLGDAGDMFEQAVKDVRRELDRENPTDQFRVDDGLE